MGTFTDLIKTSIKVVLAPIYVPSKIAEELSKPSQYEHGYHDGGQERENDKPTSHHEEDSKA